MEVKSKQIHNRYYNIRKDNILKLINMRFKNCIDKYSIYRWLNNFEDGEKTYMIDLLLKMECVTSNEIFERYFDAFTQFFNSGIVDKSLVLIHPIGKYEKSGTAMIYYINKVINGDEFKNKLLKNFTVKFVNNINDNYKLEKYPKVYLVLVDDILGTGNSAIKYYNKNVKNTVLIKQNNSSVCFVSIFSMFDAIENITNSIKGSSVFVSIKRNKAFKGSNILFNEQTKIRKICYKYGDVIYRKNSNGAHPLGYNNSQALVTFPYGTPNNTLPIIWSNGKADNWWYPIFPRFISNKLSESKERRKEFAYFLSLAKLYGKLNFITLKKFNFDKTEKVSIKKEDFIYMYILKLISDKKDVPTICQELGIFEIEYDKYISSGIRKNHISSNKQGEIKLTELGTRLIYDIYEIKERKKISLFKYKDKNFKNVEYLPNKFRGES